MASTDDARLDRLAGDATGSWGGGLPLPQLFQAVVNEMLDHGPRSVADLVGPVERAVPKPERFRAIYGALDPTERLIDDVLEQLRAKRLATVADGRWSLTEAFRPGMSVAVIPARPGRQGRKREITIAAYERAEREWLSEQMAEQHELRAMYNDMQNERIFEVKVGARMQQFRLHPLARSIPQIAVGEFMDLAADVRQHGVRVPVVIYDGQVLDGRHRVAIAAALRLPVRTDNFTGDEMAARDYVVSLNVKRRHLTLPQRTLITQELFLPEAEAKAKDRQREAGEEHGRGHDSSAPSGAELSTPDRSAVRAMEEAAAKSGGLTSVRSLQRMAPVRDAPKTKERIRSGEIKTATQARREAIKETGVDLPAEADAAVLRTGYSQIGRALTAMRDARASLERGDISGKPVSVEDWNERLHEIIDIARALRR